MFKRIDHVEIIPEDLDKTIVFYRDILGFSIVSRMKINAPPLEEVVTLKLGDTMIELLLVKKPSPKTQEWQTGYRLLAIEVEDMDKAVEYLKSKGIKISMPPITTRILKRAEIKDPNDLSIELRQWLRE